MFWLAFYKDPLGCHLENGLQPITNHINQVIAGVRIRDAWLDLESCPITQHLLSGLFVTLMGLTPWPQILTHPDWIIEASLFILFQLCFIKNTSTWWRRAQREHSTVVSSPYSLPASVQRVKQPKSSRWKYINEDEILKNSLSLYIDFNKFVLKETNILQ